MQPHPDQRFIEALLQNDHAVIREIYEKYFKRVSMMIEKNSGQSSDAADLFQDALMAIYQRAQKSEFTLTCPLDAYLCLLCKNRWINELQKKGTRKVTFKDPEGFNISDDTFRDADQIAGEYERSRLLQETVAGMGEGCRNLLELSWKGHSLQVIAEMLKNSYGYIRKKKAECMAKLISLVKQSPRFKQLQW